MLALSVPSLKSARLSATEVLCVSNVRTSGQMIDLYTATFREFFPAWTGDSPATLSSERARAAYANQGSHIPQTDRWFEWCNVARAARTMRCPANQYLRADPTGQSADVDYWWTSSFYIDPGYLNPSVSSPEWTSPIGARIQTISSAQFPSAKVAVFEMSVWHGWPVAASPTADFMTLMYYQSVRPGSIAMLDGSARLEHPQSGRTVRRMPFWSTFPYETTAWGIRGRDR